jgi:hypothetical protein
LEQCDTGIIGEARCRHQTRNGKKVNDLFSLLLRSLDDQQVRNKLYLDVLRLMTMEEAFRREKEEVDRLLREQKLEYESKIVELQKQVMETSISQSMLSSILSSSGLVDSTLFRQQTVAEDPTDCLSSRLFLVRTRLPARLLGMEKVALSSDDVSTRR